MDRSPGTFFVSASKAALVVVEDNEAAGAAPSAPAEGDVGLDLGASKYERRFGCAFLAESAGSDAGSVPATGPGDRAVVPFFGGGGGFFTL